jgi:hypothetical protein
MSKVKTLASFGGEIQRLKSSDFSMSLDFKRL